MLISRPVPKPRQSVFRITKNMHNILQGVARPEQTVLGADKTAIIDWIADNAKRYWFTKGGPLSLPEQGGADIVIVSLNSLSLHYHEGVVVATLAWLTSTMSRLMILR